MTGTNPFLSIIIPLYNNAAFLEPALESLRPAINLGVEIIIINDGSTDSSEMISHRFATTAPRARLINQSNRGYGAACNLGLAEAQGVYVAIFEPDDIVDSDFYQRLLTVAGRTQADMIRYNALYIFDKHKSSLVQNPVSKNLAGKCCNRNTFPWIWTEQPAIWNGIYKSEMLKNSAIRFCEGPGASFQDQQFMVSLYHSISSLAIIRDAGYHYRQHEHQSVRNPDSKTEAIIVNWHQQLKWMEKHGHEDLDFFMFNTFRQYHFLCRVGRISYKNMKRLNQALMNIKTTSKQARLSFHLANYKQKYLFRHLRIHPFIVNMINHF